MHTHVRAHAHTHTQEFTTHIPLSLLAFFFFQLHSVTHGPQSDPLRINTDHGYYWKKKTASVLAGWAAWGAGGWGSFIWRLKCHGWAAGPGLVRTSPLLFSANSLCFCVLSLYAHCLNSDHGLGHVSFWTLVELLLCASCLC